MRRLVRGPGARRLMGNVLLAHAIGPSRALQHYAAKQASRSTEQLVRNALYRGIWREAAEALGGSVVEIGDGLLEIEAGDARTRVWQQVVPFDNAVSLRVALDKPLVSRLLTEAGLPVPTSLEFDRDTVSCAERFLLQGDGPCVVKPARGTGGGAGTVCGIKTVADLRRATTWALRATSALVIERQAVGRVYRLLVLDGQLLDVVRNGPPTLVADGRTTIYGLIAAENRRRQGADGQLGLSFLSIDQDCLMTLGQSGMSLETVPEQGRRVIVKTATNESGPADNEAVTASISSALVHEATRAAETTGLRLAGVDIITEDLNRSLTETGGVIIEVNGQPALHRHYHVRELWPSSHVAIPVLQALSRERSLAEARTA